MLFPGRKHDGTIRVAACDEINHLRAVPGQIKLHHFLVEILHLGRRYADRVYSSAHQHTVHHEPGCALVAVEEELAQRPEQKISRGCLEFVLHRQYRGDAFFEQPVHDRGIRRRRVVSTVVAERHVWLIIPFGTLTPEMTPFQRFVAGDPIMNLAQHFFGQCEVVFFSRYPIDASSYPQD
jgi:hypothetical protein